MNSSTSHINNNRTRIGCGTCSKLWKEAHFYFWWRNLRLQFQDRILGFIVSLKMLLVILKVAVFLRYLGEHASTHMLQIHPLYVWFWDIFSPNSLQGSKRIKNTASTTHKFPLGCYPCMPTFQFSGITPQISYMPIRTLILVSASCRKPRLRRQKNVC